MAAECDVFTESTIRPILDKDSIEVLRVMCMALDSISRANQANVICNAHKYAETIAYAITTMCTFAAVVESPE